MKPWTHRVQKNNRWDIKDPKRNYIEWDINRMVKNTENDTSPY